MSSSLVFLLRERPQKRSENVCKSYSSYECGIEEGDPPSFQYDMSDVAYSMVVVCEGTPQAAESLDLSHARESVCHPMTH